MGNAGPWFAVLGFAFTDRVIIQRLTDFIWVGLDSALSRSHVNRVSGIFYALRTGLSSLQTYYMNLDINSEELASARFFPSITTYPGKDGRQDVKFKYVGYLENGLDCVTLHAQTETEPAQDIVVKFVERYSERAHHILAEMDMAPRLVHYGPLQPSNGSLCMVVMEYVHGDTFAVAKSKMDGEMVKTVKSEVRRALTLLHEHGLVFGDLRPPNVMITKEKTVQLIDFDWAGEAGQVEYPHLLSPAVTWPKGIRPLDPIEKEHDLEMWEGL
jgi:serine/threonine protein kinase